MVSWIERFGLLFVVTKMFESRLVHRDMPYQSVKRALDIVAILLSLPFTIPLGLLAALLVKVTSPGPAIYWSDRIGVNGRTFRMPKFRTMRTGTPAVATHLLQNPKSALTPVGGFLRRSSIDEIPQLWSILVGDMTLVGPRPALYNQADLIELRKEFGVDMLKPGLTGLAQIRGRDELPILKKVEIDKEYMKIQSVIVDIKILLTTAINISSGKGISH